MVWVNECVEGVIEEVIVVICWLVILCYDQLVWCGQIEMVYMLDVIGIW